MINTDSHAWAEAGNRLAPTAQGVPFRSFNIHLDEIQTIQLQSRHRFINGGGRDEMSRVTRSREHGSASAVLPRGEVERAGRFPEGSLD